MPFVTFVVVLQKRHVHPPFARDFVAKENHIVLILTDLYDVTFEVSAGYGRDVVLAVGEALDEIPDHLGDEVGRARVDVVVRVVLEEADGREFETQSGIARHAAGFLTVEAVG